MFVNLEQIASKMINEFTMNNLSSFDYNEVAINPYFEKRF